MHLRFYHTIFEAQTKHVPAELWEAILSRLNVVFAVYGHKLYNSDDPHQLHCIIEEDGTMKNFKKLPMRWQKRAKFIREVKNVGPYAFHMKLVLLDEPDLRVLDNT